MTQTQKNQQTAMMIKPDDERITALDKIAKEAALIAPNGDNPFAAAIRTANGIDRLRQALTPEVMAPIMKLQGSALGFRTDKDKEGGYPEPIVKDCTIEATMRGLPPVGNCFNILAGRLYVTKEGCEFLLRNLVNAGKLRYMITTGIPKMVPSGAEAPVHIDWECNGQKNSKDMCFPIRVNNGMGADGVMGKCKKRASAWLLSQITGYEMPEGEVEDETYTSPLTAQPAGKESRFKKKAPIDVTPQEEETVVTVETEEDGLAAQYPKLAAEIARRDPCPVSIQDFVDWHNAEKWPVNEDAILQSFESAAESCLAWKMEQFKARQQQQ